jgi:hypothetical protein
MSSPRDAISAISSAAGVFSGVFGIALFFLFDRLPGVNAESPRHKSYLQTKFAASSMLPVPL